MDSEAASLRVETGTYDEAAKWQSHGSGATYGRVMKNDPRRDTLKPDDAGDFSRGREAPMVITPRALIDLARQLARAHRHAKGVNS
jgi:hypothetical protein